MGEIIEQTNNKYKSAESLITKRIEDNLLLEIEKQYSSEVWYESNSLLVTIKIQRAVQENVKLFKDIMNIITKLPFEHYILDFSSAIFMDSTFLGTLVVLLKQINGSNQKLSIILDHDKIQILSPITQLSNLINIYSSVEEAKNRSHNK